MLPSERDEIKSAIVRLQSLLDNTSDDEAQRRTAAKLLVIIIVDLATTTVGLDSRALNTIKRHLS